MIPNPARALKRWWLALRNWWRPEPPAVIEVPPAVAEVPPAVAEQPETVVEQPETVQPPPPPPPRPIDPETRERRKQLRTLARTRREVADFANDILDRFAQIDLRSGAHLAGLEEAKLLPELMGCDYLLMHELIESHEALVGGGKYTIINPFGMEDEFVDTCWPIDEGIITRKEDSYFLTRMYTITPQEARGLAHSFTPKMAKLLYLRLADNGRWSAEQSIIGFMNGRWRALDGQMTRERRSGAGAVVASRHSRVKWQHELHDSVSLGLSLALSRRYSWHVALGARADGPRILLPTNPQGCLQFFKNRERASNMSRRAALRHWVQRHYRDSSDTGLAFVREHLRGQVEFRWSDLDCEIFVSAFDLEKNEMFRSEAEQWRAQRKHNRVRVHLKRRTAPAQKSNDHTQP